MKRNRIVLGLVAILVITALLAGCVGGKTTPTAAPKPTPATPKPTATPSLVSPALDSSTRGAALFNEGKYEAAIAEFDKAIELDPKYTNAYFFRGLAYSNKGQYDLAIADYSKAIELNPKNANVYRNRGFTYSNKEQYDLAIADYNKAIELDPKNANVYHNRGFAYYKKGQYDLAIADYSKAIELNPKNANAYHNRGLAYSNRGQYDLAIADYNKAIEFDPKNANAWNNKGVALQKLGRPAEAMESFNRALQIDPSHEYAKSNKVSLMASAGGSQEASSIVGKLTGLSSFQGAASLRIATIRAIRPDTAQVVAAIELAESLDYRVEVPPGLYMIFASVIDLQGGKQYWGSSRALRVKASEARQLDLSIGLSATTRQPHPSTEPNLVEWARIARASALSILPTIALATPYTAPGIAREFQPLDLAQLPVVTVGKVEKNVAPESPDPGPVGAVLSERTIIELIQQSKDNFRVLESHPYCLEQTRKEIQLQQTGDFNPETAIGEFRPLKPEYVVTGNVDVQAFDSAARRGDFTITLNIVDAVTGQVLKSITKQFKGEQVDAAMRKMIKEFVLELIKVIKQQGETKKITPQPPGGPLTGRWEGTFKIVTTSKIAGEVFGRGEVTGSISIALLQEKSGVKSWVSTSDIQTRITFDNTVFGEYILVFSGWNEFGDITVNPDGSLKFTGVPYLELLTANVVGGVMSGSFDRTSVSPLPGLIILKRPGGKSETVIAPVETTESVTIRVQKVSDEPPAPWFIPTPKPIN